MNISNQKSGTPFETVTYELEKFSSALDGSSVTSHGTSSHDACVDAEAAAQEFFDANASDDSVKWVQVSKEVVTRYMPRVAFRYVAFLYVQVSKEVVTRYMFRIDP